MSEVKKEPDMDAVCSVCSQQYGEHRAGAVNRCPHPKDDWLFLDTWFTPSAAPDVPVACKAYCGTVDNLGVIIGGASVTCPFRTGDGRAYCTQACADRAAKPASGEGHVDCGDPGCGGRSNIFANEYTTRSGSPGVTHWWCSEKCRAHALLNRACCKPKGAPPPAAKPQPAPWKCPGVSVGDTIRACSRPDLPQWKTGHMRCAVCQDGHVAACMAQNEAGRVRPVMRFDSVPQPNAPRIRDCYREGDGADPDYVSGQGVR